MDTTTHRRPRSDPARDAARIRRLVLTYVESRPYALGQVWPIPAEGLALRREVDQPSSPTDARIPSGQVSRQPHALLTVDERLGAVHIRDEGRANGTRLDGRALTAGEPALLRPGSVIGVGDALLVYSEMTTPAPLTLEVSWDVSPARAYAESLVALAATSDLPVLILGPTGAGKELLARAFHEAASQGRRRDRFVAVSCAGIPDGLMASELFGHKRGAFNGADEKVGLLEAADGGTVFLDEVADLPVEQQSALLRALQERKVRRLGTTRDVPIDVRLVTATSRDVDALEQEGRVRPDFLGRISGVRVQLPGLAERREEILPLFRLFFERAAKVARPLTFAAAEKLLLHDWPKNVRELEHAAKAAALFAPVVGAVDVPLLPSLVQHAGAPVVEEDGRASREVLADLLRRHGGNVTRVAEALGQSRQKIHRWLNGYQMDPESFRK